MAIFPTFPTRAVTIFGSTLLIGGLAVAGIAAPAFAHTPAVTATCDSLSMHFTGYTLIAAQPASGGNPAVAADNTPNTVTVTIDGKTNPAVAFGTTYTSTIALDDQKAHTYTVALDAHDKGYDYTVSDTTTACLMVSTPPATPPATPPVSTPPATPPVSTPPATVPPVTPPATTPPATTPPATTPPVTTPPVSTPPAVVTPPVTVSTPTPTPPARELAETGVAGWSVPALAMSVFAVLLGAGLLVARRIRRA